MSQQYPVLTYRGDMLPLPIGKLLGWDETYRPYETVDAEFCRKEPYEGGGGPCLTCERELTEEGHTHVFLQLARPETLKEQGDKFRRAMILRGLL